MVGRVGVEPTTSRLSGVRSNHLSYRPIATPALTQRAARGVSQLRQHPRQVLPWGVFPVMKGHEDGGNVLWNRGSSSPGDHVRRHGPKALSADILRKEVIQPQVPLRLPCYDFTPVAEPTVVACFPLLGWRNAFG